jgi:hypothetical protein
LKLACKEDGGPVPSRPGIHILLLLSTRQLALPRSGAGGLAGATPLLLRVACGRSLTTPMPEPLWFTGSSAGPPAYMLRVAWCMSRLARCGSGECMIAIRNLLTELVGSPPDLGEHFGVCLFCRGPTSTGPAEVRLWASA